jgi:thiol:disulfide interchange protein
MKLPGRLLPTAVCALLIAAAPAWSAELVLPAPPEPRLPEITTPTLNTPQRLESAADIVPADIAFHAVAFPETDGSITVSWELVPEVYLYRKSLMAENAFDGAPLALELPEGQIVTDEFFGESEVYFERMVSHIPAAALNAAPGTTLELNLMYQGCMKDLYCYPPAQKTVKVTLP